METDSIIAVSVVCSIIALLLIAALLINVFCLWQAKPCPQNCDAEDASLSLKWRCVKKHYHIRTYIGCLPRPRQKRPLRRVWKSYGYSLRRCWFNMCFCCEELEENEDFLDEIFAPPAVIIARAPLSEKRPETVHSRSRTSTERDSSDLEVPPTPSRTSAPKLSILSPDPIMVPMDFTPTQATIQEDTEPVSFYVYQLEGKAGERMLY